MNERRMTMDSYNKLNEYLNATPYGRNNGHRPTDLNNTRIVRTSEHSIGIKLHETIVVNYFDDGKIQLNTDGWKTITTRDRMNYWQNDFEIYQMKFIWYLLYKDNKYLFQDNMILFPSGKVELNGKVIKPMSSNNEKKLLKLKTKTDKYCKEFIDKFFKHEIEKPNQGDCFYCQGMVEQAELINGKIEITGMCTNGDHILSHIKENYFVPTLLNNAIQWNENIGLYGLAPIDKHNIAWGWKVDGWETVQPFALDITKKRLNMLLKRYISKQIGFGIT
jgi:hypothetical protein